MSRQHSSYERKLTELQRAAIQRHLERQFPRRGGVLQLVISLFILIVTFAACVVNFPMPTR